MAGSDRSRVEPVLFCAPLLIWRRLQRSMNMSGDFLMDKCQGFTYVWLPAFRGNQRHSNPETERSHVNHRSIFK